MTQDDFELLRELATNSRFQTLLSAMVADERVDLMGSIHTAHAVQNHTAAALEFGKLDFLERLPQWFFDVFQAQLNKRQSAR